MEFENMKNKQSNWKTYIGVACSDIQNGTDTEIFVFLPEYSPMLTGDISNVAAEIEFKSFDSLQNAALTGKIAIAQCIKASYFGRDNMTIPCVHRGELVHVINYDGGYTFYWMPAGRKTEVRKVERLRIFINDDVAILQDGVENTLKEVNSDNTYYIELDTRPETRGIFLRTSKSNGEAFAYSISVDTVANVIRIEDDDSNYIELDSNEPKIVLHNKNNSIVSLIKDVINIGAPTAVNITSPLLNIHVDNFVSNVEMNYTTSIKGNRTYIVAGNDSLAVTGTTAITSVAGYTVSSNAQTINVLDGSIVFVGNSFVVGTASHTPYWD